VAPFASRSGVTVFEGEICYTARASSS
jgi:hypothetical protein